MGMGQSFPDSFPTIPLFPNQYGLSVLSSSNKSGDCSMILPRPMRIFQPPLNVPDKPLCIVQSHADFGQDFPCLVFECISIFFRFKPAPQFAQLVQQLIHVFRRRKNTSHVANHYAVHGGFLLRLFVYARSNSSRRVISTCTSNSWLRQAIFQSRRFDDLPEVGSDLCP